MSGLIGLAWASLKNRRATVLLTVATLGLSVLLLLGIERVRHEARDAFLRSVAGTDLIVGARAHPVQLLLYSVFRLGEPTANLQWDTYEKLKALPPVAWTVPISLGDSHRGYRVVGTTGEYFARMGFGDQRGLEFRAGRPFDALHDAVIGADVADTLGYVPGSEIVLAHGTARVATQQHDDQPFTVVGVLARTGTAIDQGVFVSLEAIEAIHLNWRGGMPIGRARIDVASIPPERLQPKSITAVFVGLESRTATFQVQRVVNEYRAEPLTAILPGVALTQLWALMGGVERALLVAAGAAVLAALMVLLTTILATLNERRREMALLRAVGAGPRHVFGLLLAEAALLTGAGLALGVVLLEGALWGLGPWLESRFGVFLSPGLPTIREAVVLGGIWAGGILLGLFPAALAYLRSLQDGVAVDR
ncbi:MAG: ABC transporter permease [Silanimonas sp.]